MDLHGCNQKIKSNAYKIYVKPILSYASSVWNPTGTTNKSLRIKLENVQRKAARFVYSDWSWQSSPSEMIRNLKWESLENIRKRDCLVMMHKIIHKEICLPSSFLPKKSRVPNKFQPIHGRVNVYKNSFVPNTVKWWNELPKEVTRILDCNLFKQKVSEIINE